MYKDVQELLQTAAGCNIGATGDLLVRRESCVIYSIMITTVFTYIIVTE